MLAIAAVTLSTMHQSSLGSLYLLMPNMLAPQWWSPVMPDRLLPLVDRRRHGARDPRRHVDREGLAAPARDDAAGLGRADHVLVAPGLPRVPLGDMAVRGQFPAPSGDALGLAFAAEIVLGGVVPLVLLATNRCGSAPACCSRVAPRGARRGVQPHERRALRDDVPRPDALGCAGNLRAVGGRVGRVDRPDRRDDLLFGLAARLMPVLTRAQPIEAH